MRTKIGQNQGVWYSFTKFTDHSDRLSRVSYYSRAGRCPTLQGFLLLKGRETLRPHQLRSLAAARARQHRRDPIPHTGGFNNTRWFSHSPRGWQSGIKVQAGVASPEPSLLGLQRATSHRVCPHMAFPLCMPPSCCFPFSWGHQPSGMRAPPLWPHLILVTSFKAQSVRTATLEGRVPTYALGVEEGQWPCPFETRSWTKWPLEASAGV